ncbi:MAG: hypothetical protein K5770_16070 [Lachnospiraceae bacterium]|nr:hypothetical protein [Lachnospiraceae bacterium]
MKIKTKKYILCFLAAVLLVSGCFPLKSMAGEGSDIIVFSDFEELRGFCSQDGDYPESSLFCEEDDLVITDDLEIPSGMSVTFNRFTVPKGITLTVMEDARVMAYAFTVKGELINRGSVYQGDLTEGKGNNDTMIMAQVPGHIENKGEMTLTDVFGKSNIRRYGSDFSMIETGEYDEKRESLIKESQAQPTAQPKTETVPSPEPPGEEEKKVPDSFDILKENMPVIIFCAVILCIGLVIMTVYAKKKKENGSGRFSFPESSRDSDISAGAGPFSLHNVDARYDTGVEERFQSYRKKRESQLDDWLKSGLIDRQEYNELKRRNKQ